MALLERVRWFPRAGQLVSLPRNEILLPDRLRGMSVSREWTVDGLAGFLAGLHRRSWVAPVATVDTGGLGAGDTPERSLLDYLDGGLPPLWNSRHDGVRNVLLAGTVSGPGGVVIPVAETGGRMCFQVIERMAGALREILLIVGDATMNDHEKSRSPSAKNAVGDRL